MKVAVILPAAGLGTRMQKGTPPSVAETTGTSRKQFMLLEGAPILDCRPNLWNQSFRYVDRESSLPPSPVERITAVPYP